MDGTHSSTASNYDGWLKWMLPIAVCFFYPSVGLAEMIEQTAEFRSRHVFIMDFGLLMNF